jgi:hypothetical protein
MTMPRLSLYRPNRTADYQFLDRTIKEMYTVGGVDMYVHKYLGPQISGGETGSANSPGDATLPSYSQENPLFIQDLLLLENRDRAYSPDVYTMRGVYNQQDIDFDLTQFGLFLNNDTLFITFHYNYMIDFFGRKLMSGDVLELPNLKDYNPLNSNLPRALPKYYVIQDAAFASEGFSQTWLPHLWRVKATPMVNAQEFAQIIDQPFMPDTIWDPGNFYPAGETVKSGEDYYISKGNVPPGTPIGDPNYWTLVIKPDTVGDAMSTRLKDLALNDAIVAQANMAVPQSGYDNVKFYILPTGPDGEPASSGLNADQTGPLVDGTDTGEGTTPTSFGYTMGYITGDTHAPNGLPVTPGVAFPNNPVSGDYALRLDYFPNRLFRFDGGIWRHVDDNVRTPLDWGYTNETQRSSFVNNAATVRTTDQGNIPSRQSLSQLLEPQADNGNQGGNKPYVPPQR